VIQTQKQSKDIYRRVVSNFLSLSVLAFLVAASAQAAIVQVPLDLGGDSSGWIAEYNDGGGLLQINVDNVLSDRVIIQKSAEFLSPPSNGVFPPAVVIFKQVAADAVPLIVINDEILNNSTGVDWGGFRMVLVDSGDAWFDVPLTDASDGGNGFSIAPFTQSSFTPAGPNPVVFEVSNGTVPDGFTFNPGGAPDGELFIRTNPHASAPFAVFALKEFPVMVPEPTTAVLVLLGLAAFGCRRRRAGLAA